MPDATTVKITADLSQMKAEFAAGTVEFQRWAQHINAGNATAMKAFRDTAEELRQLGKDARVSNAEMDKLNGTIRTVENAAAAAGERTANAFERGSRGLAMMARSGEATGRSLNSIIAAGADIAFAFGPEGAIISGVLMVTAGIVEHFETAESKMEETVQQFNHHLNDMLLNDSPVEAARAGARAFVAELEANAKLVEDKKREAIGSWGFINPVRLVTGVIAGFDAHRDAATAGQARTEGMAADIASTTLAPLHAHDKEIEQLKGDEKQARTELTQWQERVTQLRGEGKTAELQVAISERNRLQETVNGLRTHVHGLEQDRINTAARLAQDQSLDPATRYALAHPDKPRELTDFSDEDHRSDAAISSKNADRRIQQMQRSDAEAKRLTDERRRDTERGNAMLIALQDQALQYQQQAAGREEEAEKTRIAREFARKAEEIEHLKIDETLKTRLLIAATEERNRAIEAIEKRAADRRAEEMRRAIDENLRWNLEATNKIVRAEEEKERKLATILASSGEALVRGHADLAHRIMQAAVAPIVKQLEASAAHEYAVAAKDALTHNYIGAAEHFAAGGALMAGASLVSSIGGVGGAGGVGGGAGGGSGMSSSSHLGASGSSNTQPLQVQVIVVHQDANGREISRTRQDIQRLEDRNVPIRVGGLG